jgi:hypothetical protein
MQEVGWCTLLGAAAQKGICAAPPCSMAHDSNSPVFWDGDPPTYLNSVVTNDVSFFEMK